MASQERRAAKGIERFRDCNINNHEQSHVVYDSLDLREAREGLRLFAWSGDVKDITLKNSVIQSEQSQPHGAMSAGVYASVATGRLSEITIENNTFVPFPGGLEHWGIYFVKGVSGFTIAGNRFSPAGEDAITIWHSQSGVIARNHGGGNGENSIDVKDSHDIVIRENRSEGDGEYNIVVHGVDSESDTFHITVEHNFCLRGGQAEVLTSGIAILFARDVRVVDNWVENARGAGIFENDRGEASGNEIARNQLRHNGTHDGVGAITLERPAAVAVTGNVVDGQGSGGFGIRIEGSSREVRVRENRLMPGTDRMVQLTSPEEATAETVRAQHRDLSIDDNIFYRAIEAHFQIGRNTLLLEQWRDVTRADAHSHAMPASAFVSAHTVAAASGH
jgi:hypothetical protein